VDEMGERHRLYHAIVIHYTLWTRNICLSDPYTYSYLLTYLLSYLLIIFC